MGELGVKVASMLGILLAGGLGFYQYLGTAARDSRKPFLQTQLDFCVEASGAAATLASHPDRAERNKAHGVFLNLYWGRLAIVEDRTVAEAMIAYKSAVIDQRADNPPREGPRLALAIAQACRDLILRSWNISLTESPERPGR